MFLHRWSLCSCTSIVQSGRYHQAYLLWPGTRVPSGSILSSLSSYTEDTFSLDSLESWLSIDRLPAILIVSPPPECGDIGGEVLLEVENLDGVLDLAKKDLNQTEYQKC